MFGPHAYRSPVSILCQDVWHLVQLLIVHIWAKLAQAKINPYIASNGDKISNLGTGHPKIKVYCMQNWNRGSVHHVFGNPFTQDTFG